MLISASSYYSTSDPSKPSGRKCCTLKYESTIVPTISTRHDAIIIILPDIDMTIRYSENAAGMPAQKNAAHIPPGTTNGRYNSGCRHRRRINDAKMASRRNE